MRVCAHHFLCAAPPHSCECCAQWANAINATICSKPRMLLSLRCTAQSARLAGSQRRGLSRCPTPISRAPSRGHRCCGAAPHSAPCTAPRLLPSSSLWMRRSLLVPPARLAHTVAPRACSRGCAGGRSLGLWEQCASMHALQERRLARSFRTLCSAAVLGCVLRFNCCTACCTLHISSDFTSLHFAGR